MKTLTLHLAGNTPDDLRGIILPNDIATQIATHLKRWSAANIVVIAVPTLALERMSEGNPAGEPTMKEASQILSTVLASIAQEAAELAEMGAENYSQPVAYHLLSIMDCWYQGRAAFSEGCYARAVQLAEATQTLLDDTPWMKHKFPAPLVPDHIWGTDANEKPGGQLN